MKPSCCLIATVRNEAPWLLEWIAHNIAIGFDHLVIASNDCTDGTDDMLDRLEALGHLRHIRNRPPFEPKNIQLSAYAKARATPEAQTADWIMPLDADEFLNIKVGTGNVADLVAALPPDTEAIPVSWRLFGSSGLRGFPDTPICETFTRAASLQTNVNYVKVLFRNHQRFPILKVHAPHVLEDTPEDELFPCTIRTPSGGKLRDRALTTKAKQLTRIKRHQNGWDVAQINHYITKTPELYILKKIRGNAILGLDAPPVLSEGEFRKFNQNSEVDQSIQHTATARHAIYSSLLDDPQLKDLHASSMVQLGQRLSALIPTEKTFLQKICALN